jgi:hypothetical protein
VIDTWLVKAFLRYFVEIPLPVEKADEILGQLPGEWLDQAAREANLRALLLLGSPALEAEPALGVMHLAVLLSPAEPDGHLRRRTLQWFEVIGETCEPVLRGDLELAALGPARTQLALSAQYRPLLRYQEAGDRTLAVRIGESTLKAFVDRIADYVNAIFSGVPSEPDPGLRWGASEKSARRVRPGLAPAS